MRLPLVQASWSKSASGDCGCNVGPPQNIEEFRASLSCMVGIAHMFPSPFLPYTNYVGSTSSADRLGIPARRKRRRLPASVTHQICGEGRMEGDRRLRTARSWDT